MQNRQLKPDSHRNKKHKTSVKWRNLNPIFNEEFYFETRPNELDKQSLIITVWDKGMSHFCISLFILFRPSHFNVLVFMYCVFVFFSLWNEDLGKSNDFLGSLVIGYASKGIQTSYSFPLNFHIQIHSFPFYQFFHKVNA